VLLSWTDYFNLAGDDDDDLFDFLADFSSASLLI